MMYSSEFIDESLFSQTTRKNKGKSRIMFPTTYCVVDIETTGLDPSCDEIIEIGAIRYTNGQKDEEFSSLVKPPLCENGLYVSEFITELTGITNEMLSKAPEVDSVVRNFSEFLGRDIIVGYNINFDINFLYDSYIEYLGSPLTNDYVDIMRMARKLHNEMPRHRLCDMAKLYEISNKNTHRALSDVETTESCFKHIHNEAILKYGTEEEFVKTFRKKRGKWNSVRARDIVGDETKHDPDNPLYQRYCVFTGKLEKFTRQEAMKLVADLGGINEDGVTKKTNYLILGNNDYCPSIKEGKSSKQKKAEQYKLKGYDIEIVSETVFYDMIYDMIFDENEEECKTKD